ncbi:hypothetical protein [Moraxella atlantae]|uniref:Uncharacterized protein n=1 Tax=Faucicola atlantae TaxID=34059 RepID=A0A378Q448_9GAMM|nr:hypothetical protein [Moraxella atlantae]OPH33617.1 hypothetical protein B5J92_09440 [Moraxella atlantae]STY95194.1 Uncharacterised protein [Moraxella atlantae]
MAIQQIDQQTDQQEKDLAMTTPAENAAADTTASRDAEAQAEPVDEVKPKTTRRRKTTTENKDNEGQGTDGDEKGDEKNGETSSATADSTTDSAADKTAQSVVNDATDAAATNAATVEAEPEAESEVKPEAKPTPVMPVTPVTPKPAKPLPKVDNVIFVKNNHSADLLETASMTRLVSGKVSAIHLNGYATRQRVLNNIRQLNYLHRNKLVIQD